MTTAAHALAEEKTPAPNLSMRQDLQIFPGPGERNGAPDWILYDPLRHRYFRLSWRASLILSCWRPGRRMDDLIDEVGHLSGIPPDDVEIQQVARFLAENELTPVQSPGASTLFLNRSLSRRQNWAQWLLHHYLFIRIPLLQPQRFLVVTEPYVSRVLRWAGRGLWLCLGVVSLGLTLRQWQNFSMGFSELASASGAIELGLALTLGKVVHEFGHAYAAVRRGCHVPTMGAALIVLWPVLYTDVSDAWRLPRRRDRLAVGAAGVEAELGLATLALLAWHFLPDGGWRQGAFAVATTAWVSSLAVNLSPFMRFDGYYLLSDALNVANLHDRAFALARWKLRECLFGFDDPAPEVFSPALRIFLIVFGMSIWLYRLILFTGIALMVYHFAIKLVGIGLMLVEVCWFIMRPVLGELSAWWSRRRRARLTPKTAVAAAVFVMALTVFVIPWRSEITLPAVWRAVDHAQLFPPVPARLVKIAVADGQLVAKDELMFRFVSDDLAFRIAQDRVP
ncbi:putative peptide zinc metalloprotease protein [Azospirillaceae bacterium]